MPLQDTPHAIGDLNEEPLHAALKAWYAQPGDQLEAKVDGCIIDIQEEEVRRYERDRSWRRKGWVAHERRLVQVMDRRLFETPGDLAALIPPDLVEPFTISDLAAVLDRPRWLAQKVAYCLREMGAITPAGKRGRAILYARPA